MVSSKIKATGETWETWVIFKHGRQLIGKDSFGKSCSILYGGLGEKRKSRVIMGSIERVSVPLVADVIWGQGRGSQPAHHHQHQNQPNHQHQHKPNHQHQHHHRLHWSPSSLVWPLMLSEARVMAARLLWLTNRQRCTSPMFSIYPITFPMFSIYILRPT